MARPSPTRRHSGAAARGYGAAYTNAFAAACRSTAYFIDSTTDELLTTSDADGGALTVVGPLGVDASAVGDFEIATAADGTNTGYAVLVVGGAPTSYEIDLSNGTTASAGAITRLDANEEVRDTAIAPPGTAPTQDPGDVFALTEGNKLLSINSAMPGKVCTSAGFTGQQADEKIVGIDVRPGGPDAVRTRQHRSPVHRGYGHRGADAEVDAGAGLAT